MQCLQYNEQLDYKLEISERSNLIVLVESETKHKISRKIILSLLAIYRGILVGFY